MNLLFFDIDGTLLSEITGEIPQSALDAIQEARRNGHLVFINTGRPYSAVPKNIQDLDIDGFVCGCGCEVIYHHQTLFHFTLTKEFQMDVVNQLLKYNFAAILEGSHDIYFVNENLFSDILRIKDYYTSIGIDCTKTYMDKDFSFDKFTMWFNPDHVEEYMDHFKDDLTFITRREGFYEVVPSACSKATGIQFLLDYFHLDLEAAFAFGDSNNDLAMLQYCKHAIAMAVCDEEVRKVATFITDTVENDGIEKALRHYKMID